MCMVPPSPHQADMQAGHSSSRILHVSLHVCMSHMCTASIPHQADRRGISSSRIPCVLSHDGSRTDGAFQAPVVRTNTCQMCGSALLLAGGHVGTDGAFQAPVVRTNTCQMCESALLLAGGQADVGPRRPLEADRRGMYVKLPHFVRTAVSRRQPGRRGMSMSSRVPCTHVLAHVWVRACSWRIGRCRAESHVWVRACSWRTGRCRAESHVWVRACSWRAGRCRAESA